MKTLTSFLLHFFTASSALFGHGQPAPGWIVPVLPPLPSPPRPVPLPLSLPLSHQSDTQILSQVATTHVEQVFRNDTTRLGRTYLFPILMSSLREFAIWG